MRVEAFFHSEHLKDYGEAARRAEAAGFDALAIPEINVDPFIALGAAALATERVGIRTAIAVAFPRSPMVVATSAWTLQAASGGRFTLGLGTQVKAHIERRFGVPWDKPAARMREYTEALRAIWNTWETGDKLDYRGEHYQLTLMTPEFSPPRNGLGRVPVYVAAVRPHMIEQVASYADGIRLHGFCTRRYLREVVMPAIERGLAKAGRDRKDFEVCGGGFVATGPNADAVQNMREIIRYRIGFYGSTPTYRPVLDLSGWSELGETLHAMSRSGRWADMASAVPDDVLDEFCVATPYATLPKAFEARFGGLTDTTELLLPPEITGDLRSVVGELRALPSPLARRG